MRAQQQRNTTGIAVALALAAAPVAATGGLVAQSCGLVGERWLLPPAGGGEFVAAASGLCVTAAAPLPVPEGTNLYAAACGSVPASQQAFLFFAENSTIVLANQPLMCVNIEAYGKTPGSVVWLAECTPDSCAQGNCPWTPAPAAGAAENASGAASGAASAVTLTNPISALCMQDGSALPPLPHTCEAGSPSFALPFCDPALDVGARVDDLLARLSPALKLQQWDIGTGGFGYDAQLNLKAIHWDFTCIHGVSYPGGVPNAQPLNVSVFPHAIAQAASFDLDLVARLSAATLYEARAVGQAVYRFSGGEVWAGTSCDGGPLANSVHDPRWGRISECYGEDPTLSALMGATATRALQNRSADSRWLGTSQVIRHWLGYHMADPDLPRGGEEQISLHAFSDQQAPIYRTLLVDADAEGLMCAYAAFSVGSDAANASVPAPLIPSCVHPFLWEKLREEWAWTGFVTTDCCDSITSMVDDHRYFPDLATAALASIESGVSVYFGFNAALVQSVGAMLANGALDAQLFDDRLRRTLLTRMRMGEFDMGRNDAYPYGGAYDEAQLDGPAHRALAREAVADSLVLLENVADALPLAALAAGRTLAVIGPFADCGSTEQAGGDRDSPLRCSYGHTYEGSGGAVSTFLTAAREEAAAAGARVLYAQGSNIVSAFNGSAGVAAAAAAAGAADATLLVLGLGELLEVEGLDRTTLSLPPPQQALLAAVAAAAVRGPLVVVVVSAGLVDLGAVAYAGAGHARLQSFYAGAETGHGAFDVLLGRTAPSARLPLSGYTAPYLGALRDSIANFSMVSSTGVGRTYRYLADAALLDFSFAFGLSYTTFAYTNLSVALAPAPGPGAPESAPVATVSVLVRNAGAVAAREVAQLYVSVPADAGARAAVGAAPIPLTALQAFTKTAALAPGAPATRIDFEVPLRAVLTTTATGARVLTGGNYTFFVSGHAPFDAKGLAASNVVSATLSIAAPKRA